MTHFLSCLIGEVAALVLITAGLTYIVSPKHGRELLKRLAIFLAGAFVGTCLLQQSFACVRFRAPLLLIAVATSVVAFVIREARLPRAQRRGSGQNRGAERTPVMPTHLDDEEGL